MEDAPTGQRARGTGPLHWCSSCRLKPCFFMQGRVEVALASCISVSTLRLYHSRCKCTHTQSACVPHPGCVCTHTQGAGVRTPRVRVFHTQSACVLTPRARVYHTQGACATTLRMLGQVSVVTPRAGEDNLPPVWHLSPCAQLSRTDDP